jgi:F0F1-type ATP synthase epsilon subunit
MATEDTLKVRITRATQLLWEGEAKSITSKNTDGPFDVLAMHANFVTLIRGEPIKVNQIDGTEVTHSFKYAVMYVQGNNVKIYADFL